MKKKKAIKIGIFILAICVPGILLTAWIIDARKYRQVEQERLEQEKIEQERLALEKDLYEQVAAMGQWDEVADIREIGDICAEPSVSMENLILVFYRDIKWLSSSGRKTCGFFVFSDGWIYTATEYYKQSQHDPSEIIYGLTFNDEMWEHLSDWKCLGRISSEELATIRVNIWQAKDAEYQYFPGNDLSEGGPSTRESNESLNGSRENSLLSTYITDNGKELILPDFLGSGFVVLNQHDDITVYEFWGKDLFGDVKYTKDEFINDVMQNILGNKFFIQWQETKF
jgi:hypothetical protein